MTIFPRYFRWVAASTLLFVAALAAAQDTDATDVSDTRRIPLQSGNALLSAGAGTLYSSFASAWGGELGVEFAVGEVDIGLPLVFGVGAMGYFYWLTSEFSYFGTTTVGTTIKYDHNLWAAGAHGTAHFFVSPSIDIYTRLGVYYNAYVSPDTVRLQRHQSQSPKCTDCGCQLLGFFWSQLLRERWIRHLRRTETESPECRRIV